jgi:hypothetical protein
MRIISRLVLPALVLVLMTAVTRAAEGINDDGFITKWLVLAPISLDDGQSGAEGLGKEQVKDEAKLQPKAGETVKAGGKELMWKEHTTKEHFIDFNDILGKQTENSVGYAVAYVVADKEQKGVKMKTGSDDQCKVYLNGKQVLNQPEARSLDKDQDTTEVDLKEGVNVLVFKVINEQVDWSGCVRFVDKDDKPVQGLKVKLTPN